MRRLYHLVQHAKTNDSESTKEIIHRFDPKIKQTSRFTGKFEREDLEQELRIRIVKAVDKFKTDDTPGFREFISHLSEQNSNQ
ncbi:helix-turn-helix domain-containing protein [Lentibacillus jeotgali]|uniref:helix-turn-helix domain-containing protein n=1 Tax=Lentibacillus jeotgali TaxID=558169 RepID=UPI0002627876|nr:helix-turn-helix domain-containing protein [Lentibacillus jeotgali]